MYSFLVVASWSCGSILLVCLLALFLRLRISLIDTPDVRVGTILIDTLILYSLWCTVTIGTLSLLLASIQRVSHFIDHNPWFTLALGFGWVLIPSIGIIRLTLWRRYKDPSS